MSEKFLSYFVARVIGDAERTYDLATVTFLVRREMDTVFEAKLSLFWARTSSYETIRVEKPSAQGT